MIITDIKLKQISVGVVINWVSVNNPKNKYTVAPRIFKMWPDVYTQYTTNLQQHQPKELFTTMDRVAVTNRLTVYNAYVLQKFDDIERINPFAMRWHLTTILDDIAKYDIMPRVYITSLLNTMEQNILHDSVVKLEETTPIELWLCSGK